METTELTLYQKGENALKDLQERVKNLQVTDENLTFVAESMATARKFATALDKERKAEGNPHYQKYTDINERYNAIIKPCQEIGDKCEKMIASFNRGKREEAERKQREYERQVREAEEKRLAEERQQKEEYDRILAEEESKRQAEARKSILHPFAKKEPQPEVRPPTPPLPIQAAYVPPPTPVEAPKEKIATTFGNVKIKERWTYDVVDFDKVPRDFMMVDQVGVNRAINAKIDPVREIPGLRIYPEE